ncbi:MAG: N-acetylmuramoyl-L-alanine amidase [Pseudohongiellaceae bacterium]
MRASLSTILITLCGAALSAPQSMAAVVENVRSYRAPDHTRVVFDLSGPVEHRVFTLENPDRIVVDLSDSVIRGDLSVLDLGNSPVSSLRSATRNQTDVRVVFDLSSRVQPRSFLLGENQQYGERLVIDLYDSVTSPSSPSRSRVTASVQDVDNGRRDIVVAISAGHGGEDPGAIGVDRIQEKKVVLEIAREMEKILQRTPGYRPVMIRNSDYYVDLRQRTRIAHDNNADLFIAIHADAFTNSRAQGATVYALSQRGATSEQAKRLAEKENSADLIGGVGSVSLNDKDEMLASVLLDLSKTASIASSLEAGDKIIAALGNVTRMRRTNVEQAAFVVLKSLDIPSLLVEAGYVTNPTDARNLNSSAHRSRFAQALVDGITAYFYETPPRGTLIAWQKNNGTPPSRYRVVSGDSLSLIADRYGVSLSQLKAANNLSGNTIYSGQELLIPGGAQAAGSSPALMLEHVIARGETLSGIANSYSVSLQTIRETNQLNSDTIRVGQIIRIPSS